MQCFRVVQYAFSTSMGYFLYFFGLTVSRVWFLHVLYPGEHCLKIRLSNY
jgi:hypothetical protein